MPSGARWDGVYFSEFHGFLHLAVKGTEVNGRWQHKTGDVWGELRGQVTGNVLTFSWTEHWIRLKLTKSGKGYFKYERPAGENVDDVLAGEGVPGPRETPEPWEAIKQRNIPPHIDSIPERATTNIGGGDWDTDKTR